MEIHLDCVGGIAGDMFVAAMLDTFPEHVAAVLAAIAAIQPLASVRGELVEHRDAVLVGRRFVVSDTAARTSPSSPASMRSRAVGAAATHAHAQKHPHPHAHSHASGKDDNPTDPASAAAQRPWRRIREGLEASALEPGVRRHALGIFATLAAAEAQVHGIDISAVEFHEVGAWDSIADIVAAAAVIDQVAAVYWSVGPVPLGSGRVRTAHGALPVPAPATALLLRGFATIDDGVGGERVTPTGAAILAHVCAPRGTPVAGSSAPAPRILRRQGVGFGTRVLPGLSNCVRVLAFEREEASTSIDANAVTVIEFEVDDQSGEDLALGLDRLRAHPALLDVVQMPVFGKKGRVMMHVRALADARGVEQAIQACFDQTTTIGLRHRTVARVVLPRVATTVQVDGRAVRVKSVERPHGRTAKAEADDVAPLVEHSSRLELRHRAERAVLDRGKTSDD